MEPRKQYEMTSKLNLEKMTTEIHYMTFLPFLNVNTSENVANLQLQATEGVFIILFSP